MCACVYLRKSSLTPIPTTHSFGAFLTSFVESFFVCVCVGVCVRFALSDNAEKRRSSTGKSEREKGVTQRAANSNTPYNVVNEEKREEEKKEKSSTSRRRTGTRRGGKKKRERERRGKRKMRGGERTCAVTTARKGRKQTEGIGNQESGSRTHFVSVPGTASARRFRFSSLSFGGVFFLSFRPFAGKTMRERERERLDSSGSAVSRKRGRKDTKHTTTAKRKSSSTRVRKQCVNNENEGQTSEAGKGGKDAVAAAMKEGRERERESEVFRCLLPYWGTWSALKM